MNSDLASITQHFKARNIRINPVWVSDMLYSASSSPSSPSAITRVYTSFLRTPLRVSSFPSLPENATDLHDKYVAVSEPIVLEILDIIEVGISQQSILDTISAYQSGSVKKGNTYKDIREERDKPCEFSRGMLKFVLSDGQEIVDGMEYKTIREISLNTVLGTKVSRWMQKRVFYHSCGNRKNANNLLSKIFWWLISIERKIQLSNVRVLRGVLLLDPNNTKVLGCGYDKIRSIEELKKKVMAGLG
jgi:hypothetical protein